MCRLYSLPTYIGWGGVAGTAKIRFLGKKKINIENNGRSPDTMVKLGSIPRTPTLRVLAAQQDLAFCFVYVECWGPNAMFLPKIDFSGLQPVQVLLSTLVY